MHDQPTVDPARSMTPLGSQVSTDRPCASCGFNLFGQVLYREPVYSLVVARCPECGTVASLQEYPAMTGWVNKWKIAMVSLWIVMLVGMLVGNFGAAGGLCAASTELASENYADLIGFGFLEYDTGSTVSRGSARYTSIDQQWATDNAPQILDEIGGVLRGSNKEFLAVWAGASVAMGCFGVFWSVTLLGARRRTALLLPAIAIIAAASVVFFNTTANSWFGSLKMTYAQGLAEQVYGRVFVPLTALVLLSVCAIGVFIGRPLARFVVCLMLPPRLRTPLGILWTRDGLEPPKARTI